ncbi:uncharacterized protein LOC124926648 [Impatiens glandulifera]|uniref:uncharacterized protein LOC124926648 n=1 Tax=Impatiens glandulifera TaxID=253017 RepID=UPI001FB14525|nr:uncharacterized protein LOC124926648 [Impatiens glandulifera]
MMMLKQDSLPPIPKKDICSHCNVEEKILLHHIRHQGMLRRLCTCCVLLFHTQSFCPTCFFVYDRPPPPSSNDFITCSKCYSNSHSHCVISKPVNPSYVCPLCVSPRLSVFSLKKVTIDGDGRSYREFDKKSAKVLLAAAKIATVNITKAAATLRMESEKRSKEAALTRKRARETLDHFAGLVVKEKMKMKRKDHMVSVAENSASGSNGNGFIKEKNQRFGSISSAMEHIKMEAANEVSARLNAVGLREKEKILGTGNHERMKTISNVSSSFARVSNNGKFSVVPPADNKQQQQQQQ